MEVTLESLKMMQKSRYRCSFEMPEIINIVIKQFGEYMYLSFCYMIILMFLGFKLPIISVSKKLTVIQEH